ncbi:uncharacterized protein KIAA0825 homolog [Nelusetta ayraudi]|uniref:uncharacterized protein KIAA0825 homolog n=1 Tax=Nelusetta ayraudi TaxID=303726 RepID=UPI003F72CBB7
MQEVQAKRFDAREGPRSPSPTDCWQWFNIRTHNCLKPVTTGHQELADFFRALQHHLRSGEEGNEEVTLRLLLDLSTQCDVWLPRAPSSNFSINLHTVSDDTLLEIQEVWDNIRLLLRRHLVGRLSCHSPEHPEPRFMSPVSIPERIHCLRQLLFLYPESAALAHYQRLRVQSVLDLLSTLSSSPGGETGFDRLVAGFRSVVPALTQALTDELNVLVRVTEACAVLSFLNAAYLSTVAQELTSLMERECETALRDNTTLGSKIRKNSAKSNSTAVPAEGLGKNRSFSLTSHQLRALTQLACTLLSFERTVRELVKNMSFVDFTEDTPCIKGILKKHRQNSHMATAAKTSQKGLLDMAEVPGLEFDWRSAFRGLVPHMAHCVKVVLDDACARSLQQEEALHSAGETTITLSPTTGPAATSSSLSLSEDSSDTSSERETPKMVAKFCGSIVTELDALLPLAAACSDSSLLEVRSSFVEACGRAAFSVLGRLQERTPEVPSAAPLKNLPALLSTCIYVHQRLQQYRARLKDSGAQVPLTLLPIQKCQDTAEALRERLTSYSIHVCSTSILQDEESHHWADPKPFYEGERCSFSVQMWFYFLCGLRSDLWAVLPADFAKEMLGQVLAETLQLLVQRYNSVRPSYTRQLQVRCDITAVLLYVEHLMWSVCENPAALVHSNPYSGIALIAGGSDWPYQIHSLCDQLLTVLVIVTSPLSLLYRTFTQDSAKEVVPQSSDSAGVHWLNAINPELFTEHNIRDGPVGHAAAACQLRLLTSDPGHNPRLLLRALLDGDCHLPRILLESACFVQEGRSDMSPESREAGDDFIVALFNLLSCLNNVPEALTHVLQPYLERAQLWGHLYTLAEVSQAVPVVISCLRATVAKSANGLLVHLVSLVISWQAKEEPSGALMKRTVPESVLVKIPREWNYKPPEALGKEAAAKALTGVTVQALSFIFANLLAVLASVPPPVRYLFLVAEKQLSQHSRQLRLLGLLVWTLLGCLIQGLEDLDALEQTSGLTLDRGARETLSLLAECLQAAVGIQQKGVPKPIMHKVLQTLEEKQPKWISMQLQKARKLCSDSAFERGGESAVAAAELTEQKIGLMLLEVCHRAGGSDYLRQIYHIIQGNEEVLMVKLGDSAEPSTAPAPSANFDLWSKKRVDAVGFNPLLQFDHVGKRKLDQSAVVEWAWDWPRLLPAYQGMSQVTFKTLLANRWEMQEGAELEEEQKSMVEELQKAYFVSCCSPRLQDCPESDETPEKETQGET